MQNMIEEDSKPCRQCFHGEADSDGFCSDTCMKLYDQQLGTDYDGDGEPALEHQLEMENNDV